MDFLYKRDKVAALMIAVAVSLGTFTGCAVDGSQQDVTVKGADGSEHRVVTLREVESSEKLHGTELDGSEVETEAKPSEAGSNAEDCVTEGLIYTPFTKESLRNDDYFFQAPQMIRLPVTDQPVKIKDIVLADGSIVERDAERVMFNDIKDLLEDGEIPGTWIRLEIEEDVQCSKVMGARVTD